MIDECPKTRESATVYRLASILRETESLSTRLLGRGSNPADVSDTVSVVRGKTPLSLEEAIDNTFRAREHAALPFSKGRFGDGTIAVYYSATEENTCKEEIAFHLRERIKDLDQDPHVRTYHSIVCRYDGTTVHLRGKEREHPELVSKTKTGYPFCQSLAQMAVDRGIDGFFAPSARNPGGTCVPVFSRVTLSGPQTGRAYFATVISGGMIFREA